MTIRVLILVFVCVLGFPTTRASERNIVNIAVPGLQDKATWPVFQYDNSGLYDKIYTKIYAFSDMKIKKVLFPEKRCKVMVMHNKLDIFPGGTKNKDYINSKYAIWMTEGVVAFYKKKIIPNWRGTESLLGKKILYLGGTDHLDILEQKMFANERKSAVQVKLSSQVIRMLARGRGDVYIVSKEMLETGKARYKEKINYSEYEVQNLGRLKFYPLFPKSERGQKLADIFDEGIKKLYLSGELKALYETFIQGELINMDPLLEESN